MNYFISFVINLDGTQEFKNCIHRVTEELELGRNIEYAEEDLKNLYLCDNLTILFFKKLY